MPRIGRFALPLYCGPLLSALFPLALGCPALIGCGNSDAGGPATSDSLSASTTPTVTSAPPTSSSTPTTGPSVNGTPSASASNSAGPLPSLGGSATQPTVATSAPPTQTAQPSAEPSASVTTAPTASGSDAVMGGSGNTEPLPSATDNPQAAGGAGGGNTLPAAGGMGGVGMPPAETGSICPASPGTPPSGESDATLVASVVPEDNNFHLFEGPAWLGDALYFSDISPSPWNSTIRKYIPATDSVSNFLVDAGSNGLAVGADGVLYSATARKGQISSYNLETAAEAVAVAGSFNSPNDMAISRDGTIYFSDPQQGELPAGNQPQLVHVVKGGVDAIFSEDIMGPNGVTLSPAEDILYVAGGGYTGYVKKVTLVEGLAGTVEDLATELQVPDGMTIDCAGNVYVAVHETQVILVLSPSGERLATIRVGAAANGQAAKPTNVAFGGPDRKTLYVTATYSLWQIPLDIAGYPN